MPFIAIAAIIAVALGGGVTYAADQAKPGDALYQYKVEVNDNLRHEYHAVRASLGVEATSTADVSLDAKRAPRASDADATTTLNDYPDGSAPAPSHGLMIRTDADGSSSVPATLNADGSVHVNIY